MELQRTVTRVAAIAMTTLFSIQAHAQDSNAADKPLSAYRDKNRVLLVFAPSETDAAYKEQTKLWQGEKTEFQERQLIVVPVLADAKRAADETPAALEKKYGVEAKAFAVVLLGKDGHDAYRAAKPVTGATLYGVIDAMPMRKAEMKRQQNAGVSTGATQGQTAAANTGVSPAVVPRPTPAKPDLDHDE